VVLASKGKLDPELTKPLIVDPNALSEADAANVESVAKVLASEPPSAKAEPPAADEDALADNMLDAGTAGASTETETPAAGEATSTDATSTDGSEPAKSSAIEQEIKLLSSLIDHGKAIAQALPEKEQRLKELSAQLAAAQGAEQAQGA